MNRSLSLLLVVVLLLSSCNTTRYPERRREDRDDRTHYPFPPSKRDRDEKDKREDEKVYSFKDLGIPKGHLPPPGECKVWIPGLPPGQQGPPQSCNTAFRNAPLGAWVITHTGSRYKVTIFNRTNRSLVDEVRYYTLDK